MQGIKVRFVSKSLFDGVKKMQKKKMILAGSLALVLTLALTMATASMAKSDKSSSKPDKTSQSKIKEFKNYEKPANGKSNAIVHKEKINQVASDLLDVAEQEKNKGQQKREEKMEQKQLNNPKIGQQEREREEAAEELEEIAEQLEEVAEETEDTAEDTAQAINKAEKENGFKKFLVGTDYKNLGQLRSSLVHNRNQIRKLTYLAEKAPDEDTEAQIAEQLTTLMQERTRIKEVLSENEEGFSLLGWVFRFMNGYPSVSIDEEEEADLEEDVAEAIEDADDGQQDEDEGEEQDQDQDEDGTTQDAETTVPVETPAGNVAP